MIKNEATESPESDRGWWSEVGKGSLQVRMYISVGRTVNCQ